MNEFLIGKNFENYFKENISENFEILDEPPKIKNDFDFENLRPDFKVKHLPSQIVFYLECKYLAYIHTLRVYNVFSKSELNENQINRFKKDYNNIPIFYLIGFGYSYKSKDILELYLINIKDIKKTMSFNYAKKFQFKSMNDFEKNFVIQL